jgi:hypothetical protein
MKERLASIAECIVTGGRCVDNSELDHKQIFPDDYKDYITWAADYYRTQAGWEMTLTCDVIKDLQAVSVKFLNSDGKFIYR